MPKKGTPIATGGAVEVLGTLGAIISAAVALALLVAMLT